jgi:hypothetical protein
MRRAAAGIAAARPAWTLMVAPMAPPEVFTNTSTLPPAPPPPEASFVIVGAVRAAASIAAARGGAGTPKTTPPPELQAHRSPTCRVVGAGAAAAAETG